MLYQAELHPETRADQRHDSRGRRAAECTEPAPRLQCGVAPPVPASVTLEGLHDVIQTVMGWADYHLHHFQFGSVMYGAQAISLLAIKDPHAAAAQSSRLSVRNSATHPKIAIIRKALMFAPSQIHSGNGDDAFYFGWPFNYLCLHLQHVRKGFRRVG